MTTKSMADDLIAALHARRVSGPHALRFATKREIERRRIRNCDLAAALRLTAGMISRALEIPGSTDDHPGDGTLCTVAPKLDSRVIGESECRQFVSLRSSPAAAQHVEHDHLIVAAIEHAVWRRHDAARARMAVAAKVATGHMPPPSPRVIMRAPVIPKAPAIVPAQAFNGLPAVMTDMAEEAAQPAERPQAPLSPADFVQAAARVGGLTADAALGDRRPSEIVMVRWTAMIAAHEVTGCSTAAVGWAFRRDHTSVLHARRRIAARRDDGRVRVMIDSIISEARRIAHEREAAFGAGVAVNPYAGSAERVAA